MIFNDHVMLFVCPQTALAAKTTTYVQQLCATFLIIIIAGMATVFLFCHSVKDAHKNYHNIRTQPKIGVDEEVAD